MWTVSKRKSDEIQGREEVINTNHTRDKRKRGSAITEDPYFVMRMARE